MRHDLIQAFTERLNKTGFQYIHVKDIIPLLNEFSETLTNTPRKSKTEQLFDSVRLSGGVSFSIPAEHQAIMHLLEDKIAKEKAQVTIKNSESTSDYINLSKNERTVLCYALHYYLARGIPGSEKIEIAKNLKERLNQ